MSIEAMKLAILTLAWANEEINGWMDDAYRHDSIDHPEIMSAITALRQAIEQAGRELIEKDAGIHISQQKQEPVAWLGFNELGECREVFTPKMKKTFTNYPTADMTPVYASPPQRQWVGLTDEERQMHIRYASTLEDIAFSIEAKLKQKNA